MRVICCLDDRMGMMFHDRRQSKDREVIRDMLEMCRGNRLWVKAYSRKLFAEYPGVGDVEIITDEVFWDKGADEDFCFVEDGLAECRKDRISRLILYRWNRSYPADRYFEMDLKNWVRTGMREFLGYSHEKITKEIYEKKEIACASK